jgi:hypothetical protein
MGVRSMTVRRFEEIRRRLSEGRGLREIARALGCSRDTVREVRDGLRVSPDAPKSLPDPLWMLQVDWPPPIHDFGLGHPAEVLVGGAGPAPDDLLELPWSDSIFNKYI